MLDISIPGMWDELTKEVKFLRSHWLAESSWRTRRAQWKHYMTFTKKLGVASLPASPNLICLYIAYMVHSFKYVSI